MACRAYSLNGLKYDTCPQLAGIAEAWIGNFDEFVVTPNEDGTSSEFDHYATIAAATGVTSPKLYHYSFARATGSLTSTLTKDDANGTRYYTNEVVFQFNRLEAKKHLEIEALAAGRLVVIVKDNNGEYHIIGVDNYASATAATAQSGQGFDDLNGYSTTINSMSAYLPFFCEYSDFSSFVAEPAD